MERTHFAPTDAGALSGSFLRRQSAPARDTQPSSQSAYIAAKRGLFIEDFTSLSVEEVVESVPSELCE